MATVDLEHVHKTYEGGFEAVRDFNLAIKERALLRTTPPNIAPGRYRPPDPLLAFLEAL